MLAERPWYRKQLRIVQTVLREPDIVNYDANEVVRYLKQVRANCIIINGGGIVDFFRHELPTANPNPFMKDEDILGDLTEACRKEGIKVIVRVDFRAVDKKIFDSRPDWFGMDENGEPLLYSPSMPQYAPLYAPCYQSTYRNEYAYEFTRLLMERYDFDGVWENSIDQKGMCYCRSCEIKYREDTGNPLPRGGDYYGRAYDEYRKWKAEGIDRHLRDFRAVVKSFGEEKAFCAEIFGLYYDHYMISSHDLYVIKEHFDFLVTPLFAGNQLPVTAPSTLINFMKSLAPEKTPVMLFGHLGYNNALRYVSSPAEETRQWMYQAVSAGGSFWNTIFNGQHPGMTYDRRNARLCRHVYAFLEAHEDKLTDQLPTADVHILYSRSSNVLFGSGDRTKDRYLTHFMGIEQVVQDRRLQYRILTDDKLHDEALREVKVLLVPNALCLSDAQIETIRKFVAGGGRLLATHQTSLYDENGAVRGDFGLGDVFGCRYTGVVQDVSFSGYQWIRDSRHPIAKGFEDTSILANHGNNLLVRTLPGLQAETPVTFVPKILPQPPERSWPKTFETDYPTALVHSYGEGKVVYFPNEIDRSVYAYGHPDFTSLLANAIGLLVGDEKRVESDAPPSVCFRLNRHTAREGCYLLHAVNTTSAPRRPLAAIVPLEHVSVDVTLPCADIDDVQSLFGDVKVAKDGIRREGDRSVTVTLQIQRLEEYACAWIEAKP